MEKEYELCSHSFAKSYSHAAQLYANKAFDQYNLFFQKGIPTNEYWQIHDTADVLLTCHKEREMWLRSVLFFILWITRF